MLSQSGTIEQFNACGLRTVKELQLKLKQKLIIKVLTNDTTDKATGYTSESSTSASSTVRDRKFVLGRSNKNSTGRKRSYLMM